MQNSIITKSQGVAIAVALWIGSIAGCPPAREGALVHRTHARNVQGAATVMDDPAVNDNPLAAILVTFFGSAYGEDHASPLGLSYDANSKRWSIVNADGAPMKPGLAFNVVARPGFAHFTSAQNTVGPRTWLSNGELNGKPDATPLVNHLMIGGTPNPHPVAVGYDTRAGQWMIINLDGADMPLRAAFGVAVAADRVHTHQQRGYPSVSSPIDRPWPLSNPTTAVVHTQRLGQGADNRHPTGVWFHPLHQHFEIYNLDDTAIPNGAAFHVIAGYP